MYRRRGRRGNRLRSCFFDRRTARGRGNVTHTGKMPVLRKTRLPPAAAFALLMRVLVGHGGLEVAIALLLADPREERLELGGGAEAVQGVEALVEGLVGVGGVELLVAGLAQRRAVLGL